VRISGAAREQMVDAEQRTAEHHEVQAAVRAARAEP
jgi:hypothetical protein